MSPKSSITRAVDGSGGDSDATAFSNSKPEEELLELIHYHENEVYKHRGRIAALYRIVNSRLSALTLPDELVIEVFLHYRDTSVVVNDSEQLVQSGDKQDEFDSRKWWWLVPTQICHHWRVITLTNPLFWRYLDDDIFSRPPSLDASLLRSHSASLDISIYHGLFALKEETFADTWSQSEKECLGKILNETHRIRTLHLEMPRSLMRVYITEETRLRPFELLEDLHINAITHIKRGPPVPAILHSIPRCLRSLSLQGVSVSWEMMDNLPPTVTHIKIDFSPRNPSSTCENFLNMLAKLPNLESLCLKKLPIGTDTVLKEVNLPRLKRLHLSQSHSWNILSVIESLSFPPNIESIIRVKFNSNNSIPPSSIYSIFRKYNLTSLPLDINPEFLRTSLEYNPNPGQGLSFTTSTNTCSDSWPRYFYFSAYLYGQLPSQDISPWYEFIDSASHTAISVVESIELSGIYRVLSQNTFSETLLKAGELETVTVDHVTAALYLIEAIRVLSNSTVPVPNTGSWPEF
ncbi:hypothetical protein QCA50_020274 [Cerrena zonata]|uniref:F-box domain-containing protein n=1 Tax=Cerrena zonata TaxID=2478898 RepID=A0AAW0F9E6_9APHY